MLDMDKYRKGVLFICLIMALVLSNLGMVVVMPVFYWLAMGFGRWLKRTEKARLEYQDNNIINRVAPDEESLTTWLILIGIVFAFIKVGLS